MADIINPENEGDLQAQVSSKSFFFLILLEKVDQICQFVLNVFCLFVFL